MKEEVISFSAEGKNLYGILHRAMPEFSFLMIMVIGGPQNRVGSHRSFVQIARELSNKGVTVLRFDYAGNGDAEGEFSGFESASASINSAVEFAFAQYSHLRNVVIWSLCDGAAATVMTASLTQRVQGLILCNPYIHTEQGEAKTMLKHYYGQRFFSKDFIIKVITLRFNPLQSLQSLMQMIIKTCFKNSSAKSEQASTAEQSLPKKVYAGILNFVKANKPIHLFLSTEDFTAKEFQAYFNAQTQTAELLNKQKVIVQTVEGSDHTFSTPGSKNKISELTWRALQPFMSRG